MKKSVLILLILWIILAVVDIVGIFVHIPLIFPILFGGFNTVMIFNLAVLIRDELKTLKKKK